MFYSVVLVSAIQRHKSAIVIHGSPPSPPASPALSSSQGSGWAPVLWRTAASRQPPSSRATVHAHVSAALSVRPTLPSPHCAHTPLLHHSLHSFTANKFNKTIFSRFPTYVFSSVQFSPSVVSDSLRPHESLSITNSRSSLRLISIESVMPSSHLILCRPLLLLPPIPPASESFPISQLFT